MQRRLTSIFCTATILVVLVSAYAETARAQYGGLSRKQGGTAISSKPAASSATQYRGFSVSSPALSTPPQAAVTRNPSTGADPYDPSVWSRSRKLRSTLSEAEKQRESSAQPLLRFARNLQGDAATDEGAEELPTPNDSYSNAPPEVIMEDGTTIAPPGEFDPYAVYGGDCQHCDNPQGGQYCPPGSKCCKPGWVCVPLPPFDDVQFGLGMDVFDRPIELDDQGDFGLQESVNIGGRLPLLRWWDLGYQVGFRAIQSEVSGTSQAREQYFFTAGLFRPSDTGWQWGVVFDHLSEDAVDWDERVPLSQARGEIGYLYQSCREVGYLGMHGLIDHTLDQANVSFEVTSQNLFFHRWYFADGSEGRLWGGFSNHGEGIVGGDAKLPLSDRVAMNLAFNFLIPEDSNNPLISNGAWDVSVSLVWHLGGKARGTRYRPMFDVANNGSFLSRFK
ncbi:MAG: hypothetical protein KDA42_00785 [Planctomycetales bacterium]|nr:hypothetical protein [Planctomycetales bacterium]